MSHRVSILGHQWPQEICDWAGTATIYYKRRQHWGSHTRQKQVLPFVFRATSFLTSRHQLSFFWLSKEAWVFLSTRALWMISRNCGQNWRVLNISSVYRCMDLKWWMNPLVGLKISSGVLSLIFTAFRILLKYKAWGRSCSAIVLFHNTWRGGKIPIPLARLWCFSYIPACRKPQRLILSLP